MMRYVAAHVSFQVQEDWVRWVIGAVLLTKLATAWSTNGWHLTYGSTSVFIACVPLHAIPSKFRSPCALSSSAVVLSRL